MSYFLLSKSSRWGAGYYSNCFDSPSMYVTHIDHIHADSDCMFILGYRRNHYQDTYSGISSFHINFQQLRCILPLYAVQLLLANQATTFKFL